MAFLDGTVTVTGDYPGSAAAGIAFVNPSFEQVVSSLATPLLNPPMSGVIGGWNVSRTALVRTGPTVPQIGTRASATSTSGTRQAYITFGLSVTGSGVFNQQIAAELRPNTIYEMKVDVGTSGVLPIDSQYGFRVFAGAQLIASTDEALTVLQ